MNANLPVDKKKAKGGLMLMKSKIETRLLTKGHMTGYHIFGEKRLIGTLTRSQQVDIKR